MQRFPAELSPEKPGEIQGTPEIGLRRAVDQSLRRAVSGELFRREHRTVPSPDHAAGYSSTLMTDTGQPSSASLAHSLESSGTSST